jgi:hypothetical protein
MGLNQDEIKHFLQQGPKKEKKLSTVKETMETNEILTK